MSAARRCYSGSMSGLEAGRAGPNSSRLKRLTSALCALVVLVSCGKTSDGGSTGADVADSGGDAEPNPDSGVGFIACEAQDCSIASELCCEVLVPSEDSAGLQSATCQAGCATDAGARMQSLALGCDQAQDCSDGEQCCLDGSGSACRAQCASGAEVACYELNVRGYRPCQTPGCSRKDAVPGCWRPN